MKTKTPWFHIKGLTIIRSMALFNQRMSELFGSFQFDLPLTAGICALTGQVLALGELPPLPVILSGFICPFFLSSAVLFFKKSYDDEIVPLDSAGSPASTGLLPSPTAVGFGVISTLIGFLATYALGISALCASTMLCLIGLLIAWRRQQTRIPTNLAVSFLLAGTFIFGAFSVQRPLNGTVWIVSLLVFFLGLGAGVVKCSNNSSLNDNAPASGGFKGLWLTTPAAVGLWSVALLISLAPFQPQIFGVLLLVCILIVDAFLLPSSGQKQ